MLFSFFIAEDMAVPLQLFSVLLLDAVLGGLFVSIRNV